MHRFEIRIQLNGEDLALSALSKTVERYKGILLADPSNLESGGRLKTYLEEDEETDEGQILTMSEFLTTLMSYCDEILSGKVIWLMGLEESFVFHYEHKALNLNIWHTLESRLLSPLITRYLTSSCFEIGVPVSKIPHDRNGPQPLIIQRDYWLDTLSEWGEAFRSICKSIVGWMDEEPQSYVTQPTSSDFADYYENIKAFLCKHPELEESVLRCNDRNC